MMLSITANHLDVDVLPLVAAADALMQSLHTWLHVAREDTIKVDLFAAATDYLITELQPQININHSHFITHDVQLKFMKLKL